MNIRRVLDFIQEIGTVMYVGGILSHIVIGAVVGHPDAATAFTVYNYKEMSAYILILPGLAIKFVCDLIMYFQFADKPNWLKIKLAMMIFLATNAFIFLVPMMPELVAMAEDSIAEGQVSEKFLDLAHTEQLVGISNVIPLLVEFVIGSFKPKLFSER